MRKYDQGAVKDGPTPDTSAALPEEVYQERCRQFGLQRDDYARLSQQTGTRNVMLFFGALFCLFVAAFGGIWLFFFGALALFVAFVMLFIRLR